MELYEAINQRRTIRDLQDKEIAPEVIERMIQAGLKAPTNDHMRSWEFVVITDPEEKARLITALPNTVSAAETGEILDQWNMSDPTQRSMYMDAIPKQHSMLYHSGCLILPFYRQDWPLLKPERISSLNAFASIWLCIENIFLAATVEGLYGVLRIPAAENELENLRSILHYPDNYIMPCYISLGYPAENAVIHEQHVPEAKDRIHINRW